MEKTTRDATPVSLEEAAPNSTLTEGRERTIELSHAWSVGSATRAAGNITFRRTGATGTGMSSPPRSLGPLVGQRDLCHGLRRTSRECLTLGWLTAPALALVDRRQPSRCGRDAMALQRSGVTGMSSKLAGDIETNLFAKAPPPVPWRMPNHSPRVASEDSGCAMLIKWTEDAP